MVKVCRYAKPAYSPCGDWSPGLVNIDVGNGNIITYCLPDGLNHCPGYSPGGSSSYPLTIAGYDGKPITVCSPGVV